MNKKFFTNNISPGDILIEVLVVIFMTSAIAREAGSSFFEAFLFLSVLSIMTFTLALIVNSALLSCKANKTIADAMIFYKDTMEKIRINITDTKEATA